MNELSYERLGATRHILPLGQLDTVERGVASQGAFQHALLGRS